MWIPPPTSILITYKTWRGFSVLLSYFPAVTPFPSSYCFLPSSQEQSVMWTPPPIYISVPSETWRGSLFLFSKYILHELWRGSLFLTLYLLPLLHISLSWSTLGWKLQTLGPVCSTFFGVGNLPPRGNTGNSRKFLTFWWAESCTAMK